MSIKEQVAFVKESLKEYPQVKIVAATKAMSIEQVGELYDAGIKAYGENRADMFLEKYTALKDKKDIEWHFFGTVQSRKIKDLANKINCLHSLDHLGTALELDKRLIAPLDAMIEINISEEPSKSGIPLEKTEAFVKELAACKKIRITGLMCIANHTFDQAVIKKSFMKMKAMQQEIEALGLPYAPCHELSMGMSNDYLLAAECGSTLVRLGRIFLK